MNAFNLNDVVRHKSGGPLMVVGAVELKDDCVQYTCRFWSLDNFYYADFFEDELERVGRFMRWCVKVMDVMMGGV